MLGGGAAGFFAAIHHKTAYPQDDVLLLEKSATVLSKVKISGGGRCNVTHACFDPQELIRNYPRGGQELLGPFHRFQPRDTMDWFEAHGIRLKTEADNRVFPTTNSSQTIIDCLLKTAEKAGVRLLKNQSVTDIRKSLDDFEITVSTGAKQTAQKVILATGSSREGYRLAETLGHTLIPPVPSLFTFTIQDPALTALSGLSVTLAKIRIDTHPKQEAEGPVLITHWGLSGPAVIKLSAWAARELHATSYKATLSLNWLPRYTPTEIETRCQTMQTQHPHKQLATACPFKEIPTRLWEHLIRQAKLSPTHPWKTMSQKAIRELAISIQNQRLPLTGKGVFKEEFVTCGGVSLKEVNFKTMESKRCPGLFFAGEILDIDGLTGGFNFQNAWTTGWIAGTANTIYKGTPPT